MEPRNTARFSTLRAFKFSGSSKQPGPTSQPGNAPGPYAITPYMMPSPTASQLSLNTINTATGSTQDLSLMPTRSYPHSPNGEDPRFLSPNSPLSAESSSRSASPSRTSPSTNAFKKGFSKLSSLGKSKRAATANAALQNSDAGISTPWNFQHNIHVNIELHGLPPSWATSLAESGISADEIAALRGRRRVPPPSIDVTQQYTTAYAHPSASAPASSSSAAASTITPKPRKDSLRRTASNYPYSHSNVSSATDALNFVRRPPSPTSPTNSHQQWQSNTPPASLFDSSSNSRSSPRSPIPPPLNSRLLRVINDDPEPGLLRSPPPAYVPPNPTPMDTPQRPRSIEKLPLPEVEHAPDVERAPEVERAQVVTSIVSDPEPQPEQNWGSDAPESEPQPAEDAPRLEEENFLPGENPILQEENIPDSEGTKEESEEVESLEDSEGADLDSSPPRMSILPPRLSLHTDDDDWANIFSFLPSSSTSTPSKRAPISSKRASPSNKRTSFSGKRASLIGTKRSSLVGTKPESLQESSMQAKRRSRRLPGPLPLATLNNGPPILLEDKPPMSSVQEENPRSSPQISITAPEEHEQIARETTTSVYITVPPQRKSEFGIVTPDPRYPIAASPLWEEVRTLVRHVGVDSGVAGENPDESTTLVQEQTQLEQRHDSLVPTTPTSRFSDASTFANAPSSRFSEASVVEPRSRFSDATSYRGDEDMRYSGYTDVASSRFSEVSWRSTAPHDPRLASFTPMETMPESPGRQDRAPHLIPQENLSPRRPIPDPLPLQQPPRSPRSSPDLPRHPRSPDLPPPRSPTNLLPPQRPPPEIPRPQLPLSDLPPLKHSPPYSSSNNSPLQRDLYSTLHTHILQRRDIPPPLPPPTEALPPPPSPASVVDGFRNLPIGIVDASNIVVDKAVRSPVLAPPAVAQSRQPPSRTHSQASSVSSSSLSPRTRTSPPPLPLPPSGKILPSMIMLERRRQRSQGDSGSPSASSSSSYSGGLGTGQLAEFSAKSPTGYEEPLRSPRLAYVEDEPRLLMQRLVDENGSAEGVMQGNAPEDEGDVENADDDEGDDTLPPAQLQKGVLAPSQHANGGDLVEAVPESAELEPHISESPGKYDRKPLPKTPPIDLNSALSSPSASQNDQGKEEIIEVAPELELPLVLFPLRSHIRIDLDPLDIFHNLQEVAQGQYGSVYSAQLTDASPDVYVAVKKVPIPPNGTPKIAQLRHELALVSQVRHEHILTTDGLFWDDQDDFLWLRMELMDRSLADVLALGEQDLTLEEEVMARFASDILLAISYLCDLNLAHRDVRSDNILINGQGVLKLADFSSAVHLTRQDRLCFDIVGVHHWQAPEIRTGRYDASLVDVWSLGATCWEMAELIPPFVDIEDTRALSDRWPRLSRAEEFSPTFHDFLRLCSEPPASRPSASKLLHHPFIQQACPRESALEILYLCRRIEGEFQQQDSEESLE